MMFLRRLSTFLVLGVSIAYVCRPLLCSAAHCEDILGKKNEDLIDSLKNQSKRQSSPCTFAAIKRLGSAHDSAAVDVLIDYLAYWVPPDTPGLTGILADRGEYPAVFALSDIGAPAVPSLVIAIESLSDPKTRSNAVRAFALIYRDDLAQGIHELKQRQRIVLRLDGKRRLAAAISELVKDCAGRSEQEVRSCELAMK